MAGQDGLDLGALGLGGRPDEDRRRVVADRAGRLFSRQGVRGTPMEDIARGADLSLGELYALFPTREDVVAHFVRAVLREVFRRYDDAVFQAATFEERLFSFFQLQLDVLSPYAGTVAEVVTRAAWPLGPTFWSLLEAQRGIADFLREQADVARRRGELDSRVPPRVAAAALWGFQQGLWLYYLSDNSEGKASTTAFLDRALRRLLRWIGGTPAASAA